MNTSKRYRLLLHIGFPKTATTSLQHNVLMPLHEEGRVNFLGRCYNDSDVHDLLEDHGCYSFKERPLSQDEIPELRRKIESLLDSSKLNVISNESLVGFHGKTPNPRAAYQGYFDNRALLTNMAALFENCDVTLMLALREPTALLLRLYAPFFFMSPKPWVEPATFSEVTNVLLSLHRPEEIQMNPLFYNHYLPLVSQYFSNIKVLLYEDIQNDPEYYFRQLADFLGMDDPEKIQQMFGAVRYNVSSYSSDGLTLKRSKTEGIAYVLRLRFRWVRRAHKVVRKRLPVALLKIWRHISFRVSVNLEYAYPDTATRELVRAKLSVSTDYLTKTLGVDPDKLVRYGYCVGESETLDLETSQSNAGSPEPTGTSWGETLNHTTAGGHS